MSHYTMLYKCGEHTRNCFGRFHFYFILILHFGVFSVKQLFHSRLFDMR